MDSIAVYDVKPEQLPAPETLASRAKSTGVADCGPSFDLEVEHRVWLAKFKVDQKNRSKTDPIRIDWDAYEPALSVPELWQPSFLATGDRFDGTWATGALPTTSPEGPLPGDRVVMYRQAPHNDVVGVVLITGAAYGQDGAVRYSHRPLVSCLSPVKLKPALRLDSDMAEAWNQHFGLGSRSKGSFLELEGTAISAILRTVGIDPGLLCGPINHLPDCSMSNVLPGPGYRPATYLRTGLSDDSMAERRAVAEAVDWLLADRGDDLQTGFADVETVAGGGSGVCLVARHDDLVAEVVAVPVAGPTIDDIELCPTIVLEAVEAAAEGRNWSLVVTLDALGHGRTLRFDAAAVAVCFDPQSGRVGQL